MSWPLSQDYNEAVQDPSNFGDPQLRSGSVACNAIGLPLPRSGNFADVYRIDCPDGSAWAVKCFTREVPGLAERYAAIDRHLRAARLPFTVGFGFLPEGLRVRGRWLPLLKMRWVEGLTLNEFVKAHRGRPGPLEALARIWVKMAARLRAADVAHADLQHGNVLLVQGGKGNSLGVRLIDYDGMWVPELRAAPSGEVGHPAYQHPDRAARSPYGPDVDRFPHVVIYSALRAVRLGEPSWWERFDTGDNLLFRKDDFLNPQDSPLIRAMWKHGEENLQALAGHLALAARSPVDRTPWLDELVEGDQVRALTGGQRRAAIGLLGEPAPVAVAIGAAPTVADTSPWADLDSEDAPFVRPTAAPTTRRYRRSGDEPEKSRGVMIPALAGGGLLAVGLIAALAFAFGGKGETDDRPDRPDVAVEVVSETTEPEPGPRPVPIPALEPDPPPKPLPLTVAAAPRLGWDYDSIDLPEWPVMFDTRLSADGSLAVGTTRQGQVLIIDARTGRELHRLEQPRGRPETRAALGPDGSVFVLGNDDKLIRVYDIGTGELRRRFVDPATSNPHRVYVTPNGERLMILSPADSKIEIFDADSGSRAGEVEMTRPLALAMVDDGRALVCGFGGVRLCGTDLGQTLRTFDGFDAPVQKVAVGPDGRFGAASSAQQGLRIWDLATGEELAHLPEDRNSRLMALPDGRHFLVAGSRESRVIDADGETVREIGPTPEVMEVTSSADHSTIALIGFRGGAKVFRRGPAGPAAVVARPSMPLPVPDSEPNFPFQVLKTYDPLPGAIRSVAIGPDGRSFACVVAGIGACLVDPAGGMILPEPRFPGDGPDAVVRFAPNGEVFFSARMPQVRIWNPAVGEARTIELPNADQADSSRAVVDFALSADGNALLLGGDAKLSYLVDAATGRELATFDGPTSGVVGVAISPDGRQVALSGSDRTVRLHDARTGQLEHTLELNDDGDRIRYSADGNILSVRGRAGRETQLWNPRDGERLRVIPHEATPPGPCREFLPAPGGPRYLVLHGDSVGVGSTETGLPSHFHGLARTEKNLGAMALSPEGRHLLVGADDGRMWLLYVKPDAPTPAPTPPPPDPAAFVKLLDLVGPSEEILDADFSRDGKYICLSGKDKLAYVLDAETGRQLKEYDLTEAKYDLVGMKFRSPAEVIFVTSDGKVILKHWESDRTLKAATVIQARPPVSLRHGRLLENGREVLVGGNGAPAMVDLATERVTRFYGTLPGGSTDACASADGALILRSRGPRAELYDRAGTLRHTFAPEGAGIFRRVAFSPNDRHVAALEDGAVRIWDVSDGAEVRVIRDPSGNSPYYLDMAFTPDSGRLVTVSSYGGLQVWDADTGELKATTNPISPTPNDDPVRLAISRDGERVLVGTRSGAASVWRLPG